MNETFTSGFFSAGALAGANPEGSSCGAPARTPAGIVQVLNRDMVAIIGSPTVRAWLVSQGAEPVPGTPEELTAFLKADIEKWGKVIRAAGIKAE